MDYLVTLSHDSLMRAQIQPKQQKIDFAMFLNEICLQIFFLSDHIFFIGPCYRKQC